MSADDLFDPDALHAALAAEIVAAEAVLLDAVGANLDGGVLVRRSGALLASVRSAIEDDGDVLALTVGSEGVPYAAIQEYGGHTAAHAIVATKARVLAFLTGGGMRFATRVAHPGSAIPARRPFGTALDAVASELTGGLKAAVTAALAD